MSRQGKSNPPAAPRPGPHEPGRGPTSPAGAARRLAAKEALEAASPRYVLRLYVTGTTPGSTRAIERVRSVCEEHLHGNFELEVIDIYQMPSLATDHQIIATPTLVKELPLPLRRFIGDLSNVERVLFGLDVREKH
jgi:circadian clock protein KaiB